MNNFNGLDNHKDNDRTKAFNILKTPRKVDSIWWIISALLLFFVNLISLGRITIVGQFIDDVIFNLPFGWFKYFLYLLFFILDFSIYFGIKFKPKKRFIFMILLTWIALCWIISSILFIVAYHTKTEAFKMNNIWSKTILKDSILSYLTNWKNNSLWTKNNGNLWIAYPHTYFSFWAGGGLIGTVLAGISSYTTIYCGLVICLFFFILDMMWIFTGDAFFFFKPKAKRTGKSLRILSLKNNKNISVKNKNNKKNRKIFSLINLEDNDTYDEREILASVKESDITIELPSFNSYVEKNIYDESTNNFYHNDFSNIDYDISNFNNSYINNNQYQVPIRDSFNVVEQVNNVESNSNNKFDINNNSFQGIEMIEEKPQYTPRRDKKFEMKNDWIIPGESKYGKVTTEKAREELAKETNITPFGANGKTQEIIRSKTKKEQKNNENVLNGQITLDDYLNQDKTDLILNINKDCEDYTSPMQENLARNILSAPNIYSSRNNFNQTIEVNKIKAVEKKEYVNDNYQLPPIDILNSDEQSEKKRSLTKKIAEEKAQIINQTFERFNVKASVDHINIGPNVIKFEVLPDPGTKVNSITSLENDIKLALATQNVRIEAPIQGKTAVGIEIPNDNPEVVTMRSVIEKLPMVKFKNILFFAIGKSVGGDYLFGELDKMPHLLVAGSTGSGKSVMINGIISSILMKSKPHEVKFLMIDPKKVELQVYSSIPHLLCPVISDMNLANSALKKVIKEMERRFALFTSSGVKNIESYNEKHRKPELKLPYYVIIIDELADLMMTANRKDVEDSITRLTQLARASGIHLIIATQRPSTDVITGVIKSNIPVRIAFSVTSGVDSRTILDHIGAEKLIGRGDLLYTAPGSSSLIRAQGVYISDQEIEKLVKHCSEQQPQYFDNEFLKEDHEEIESVGGAANDPMFNEIKNYLIEIQKASTSLIQRRFNIGYNRASRIIDELEMQGVIGPINGSKPRDVYIKKEDIY